MKGYIKREILKVTKELNREEDLIAVEKRLRLRVNGQEILKLYCSPTMVRELVAGFIMTEGIIEGSWCAERMEISYGDDIVVDVPAEGEVNLEGATITSGCVGGITFDHSLNTEGRKPSDISLGAGQLRELFQSFQRASNLYNLTGCIHSAAISDGKSLIVLAEDIGRHNAVDKAIGYCFLENIPLNDKIILVSGRLSSEMVSKCIRWAIPVVVSRTAPTALSVSLAEKNHITLIGFMRGIRFNIYTHPERVRL
ncbi:MAG: formate dehydrogenase accessory sulfurtransferase FdhD [Nitrospirae bacterium]|nr:MAG: formate dehydrogenase accessory sulfurtransferase FdhD [Nitrospirota bacterium]